MNRSRPIPRPLAPSPEYVAACERSRAARSSPVALVGPAGTEPYIVGGAADGWRYVYPAGYAVSLATRLPLAPVMVRDLARLTSAPQVAPLAPAGKVRRPWDAAERRDLAAAEVRMARAAALAAAPVAPQVAPVAPVAPRMAPAPTVAPREYPGPILGYYRAGHYTPAAVAPECSYPGWPQGRGPGPCAGCAECDGGPV